MNKLTDKRKCILVIDDLPMNIELAIKGLSEKYDILTAQSGEEGFDSLLANRDKIDLILLDIILPQMDGFAFMEEMRRSELEYIPVIIMTADHDIDREVLALRNGAADFVRKPLYSEILLNRIENVLMRHSMEYDSLTGLNNRSKMFAAVKEMVKKHHGQKFAFLRYDIDNFSFYNSSMGEDEGDKLLIAIASQLKRLIGKNDICQYGRVDADVFCLCELYNKETIEEHIKMAVDFLEKYRSDYRIESSVGICVFDDTDMSIETVYTNASLAAHTCKGIFDKTFAYYEDWMRSQHSEEQSVLNEMVYALENHQFVPYLQPKYDLESDEPCGAEVLVRWMHPQKGMVSPDKFIPVFEKNGFIAKLDFYMWDTVCQMLQRWRDEGRKIYPISVNVSRISMYNPHLNEVILELISRYNLTPDLLQLEVTESAYMTNPDLMKETVSKLQKSGFTILMDDFGSGYSSLNTLKEIHVDILKVDMKFLPNDGNNSRSEKILSSVIRMAGWLGVPTIAEGVETEAQRDFLKDIGCDYVQGYYYAKPMPVNEYESLIGKSSLHLEKTIRNGLSSAVWSSDEKINEILTGIQLPVAIIENAPRRTEIVRVNMFFSSVFGKDFERHLSAEEQKKFFRLFTEAEENEAAEGEFIFSTLSDKKRHYRVKVKCLEKAPSASLLCAIMVDITTEKRYEAQFKKLDELIPNTKKTKMLIVDDSEIVRNVVRMLFENQYEVFEADNGQKALEILRKETDSIAVILLDMIMPIMGGKEFLLEKKQLDHANHIPVIVMSANSDTDMQVDMLSLGVNDYITKPFNNRIFKHKVENAIMFSEQFVKIRNEYEQAIADEND